MHVMARAARPGAGTALAIALVLCPAPAPADTLSGTRSDLVSEQARRLDAMVHRDHVELSIERTLLNGGRRHDQAIFEIDAPPESAAVGLRTLGSRGGHPAWCVADLLPAEEAARKYEELTGLGQAVPKDPAWLYWVGLSRFALQVFPCAPGETKTVEYRLLLPTHYHDGAYWAELGPQGERGIEVSLRAAPATTGDRVSVNGRWVTPGEVLHPGVDEPTVLRLAPARRVPLEGQLVTIPVSSDKHLVRYQFTAAPKISHAPRAPYVTIVLDESRSFGRDEYTAARAAARVYLASMPTARVELVGFARQVRPRYGRFVPAAEAVRDLAALPYQPHNGSRVELALGRAEELLSAAPAGHDRRVLLLTDALVASSLRPGRIRASVGRSGAIVHVGVASGGKPGLERDDDHPWAMVARKTGGLVWRASASTDARDQPRMKRVYEEWVRPLRLDRMRVVAGELTLGEQTADVPPSLAEGDGFGTFALQRTGLAWMRLEGELWSKKTELVVHPDPAGARTWAALAFGQSFHSELSEEEQRMLAELGRAVSPVTSYLAIEPGVRPSTEGFGRGAGGGHLPRAPSVRMGATMVGYRQPQVDRQAYLDQQLGAAWRVCGGPKHTATATFETTRAEIVDVVGVSQRERSDPALRQCLEEAVWELELPGAFTEDWNVWKVDV
jgi:hypothetical protein